MLELKPYDPDLRETDSALRPPALPTPPVLQQQTPTQDAGQIVSFIQSLRRISPILLLIATIWSLCGIFASLPFLASPGTLTGNALTQIGLGIVVWLGGLIAIVVGGTLLINRMTASRMNVPIVLGSADQVQRGERLDLTYIQKFKKETRIQSVTLSFAMRETVTYTTSSDTKTFTYSWVFADEQRPGRVMQPGAGLEERISFDIPPQAMHTFVAKHNRIQWFVGVKLDIPGGPDINNFYEIIVLPEAES